MDYKINIAQLTWQVFGAPGYLLPIPDPQRRDWEMQYPNLGSDALPDSSYETASADRMAGILDTDQKVDTSLLNQPLFDVLKFEHSEDNFTLELKDAPIVSVSLPRNIVKTAIQGRKKGGTVKEFVSNDDYHISVNGLLADMQDKMPWDKMKKLNEFLTAARSYKVYSVFLGKLNIQNVVVDQIGEIKPVDGHTNIIQYSFTLLSDDAPELSI